MDIDVFSKSSTGQLILVPRGDASYHAFVPNPLPKSIGDMDLTANIQNLLSKASMALGRLGGIGYLVPNPDFLVIPYTRLEAVASSRIEGTQTSLSELFYFEAANERPPRVNDITEVRNYLNALYYGLDRLNSLPLSLRLVREIHERLMTDVRGGTPDRTPGEFRKSQNWIAPAGYSLNEAKYVPPPPDELMRVLGDWEKFLHEAEMPVLLECAMMHYQFETIHPFLDGNGRVGRLLITLLLCARKALPYPLLYLSDYFEKNRAEYYDRLLAVSRDGDWHGWLRFFLQGVINQSNHAIESAKRIIDQREQYRQILQNEKVSSTVLALLDYVFTMPYLNARQVSEKLSITFPTAQNAIDQLENLKILEEVTGKRRNRIYVARQLLQSLVENEPIYSPKEQRSRNHNK